MENHQPTALFISGFDPGGGAGLIADTRAAATLHCRALGVLTCNTVQDDHTVSRCTPADPVLFADQIDTLITTSEFNAIKIGLIPNAKLIDILADKLHTVLSNHPDTPIVLDPVIISGSGYRFCDDITVTALTDCLLPLATVITPNLSEAQQLIPNTTCPGDMAADMLARGCRSVLITSEGKSADTLTHRLYRHRQNPLSITCELLPGRYHGSGCTLASAIACFFAAENTCADAVTKAIEFTYRYLRTVKPVQDNR